MKVYRYLCLSVIGFMLSVLSGCTFVQPTDYTGIDYVYLNTVNNSEIHIGQNNELKVKITTVLKADRDIVFHPVIKSLDGGPEDGLSIIEKEVVMKKGERYAYFTLTPNKSLDKVFDSYFYELSLSGNEEEHMPLFSPLRIQVEGKAPEELTEQKKELIAYYKSVGMDLAPFLGYVDIHTIVNIPADGLIKGFETPKTEQYDGKCFVTLSDKSTKDKVVLKMTGNAMGMKDFFLFALRKNTVENDEFWLSENAGPNFKKVLELINWNKNSIEKFSVDLDELTFVPHESGKSDVKYIGKGVDSYGDRITVIPFIFHYTAWDRMKKLIDEGNEVAVECQQTGATPYPTMFLNNTDIKKDLFELKPYPKLPPPQGMIDCKKGIMKYHFLTSVENAGWYITVDVEIKGRK